MSQNRQRILISGAGLVTGLGLSREQTWESILRGQCAMGPMSAIETPLPPGKDGGQAPDLPHDFAPELPREARYLKWAITQALDDAHVEPSVSQGRRCVCLLGTTLHGMRAAGRYLRSGDLAALGQFLAGTTLQLAIEKSLLRGWSATTCSACSSSLGSIAPGSDPAAERPGGFGDCRRIRPDQRIRVGGIQQLAIGGRRTAPAVRENRQGMKLAEGYGVVVLERAGDAARRKINPLATILGWGESADAHHLTQPHPEGARRRPSHQASPRPGGAGSGGYRSRRRPCHWNARQRRQRIRGVVACSKIGCRRFRSSRSRVIWATPSAARGTVELILSAMAPSQSDCSRVRECDRRGG